MSTSVRSRQVVRPEPSRGQLAKRAGLELIPAYLVTLVLLPFIISGGHAWPWNPATIDMQVYVYAVKDLLAGKDIFLTVTPVWHLYFIYPPIAAILMIPLAFGPYAMWQLLWAAGLIWAQWSVLKRCGVPRGAKMALIMIAVVVAVEPLRTTLGYGQVNTLLMAFVVIDLLPDPTDRSGLNGHGIGGGRRRIPRGVLIGLAASIKLTPALFVIFLLLLGKKREALWGMISFAFFTGIGAIFQPQQTLAFAMSLLGGNTHTASPLYVGNQSLLGVFFRLIGKGTSTTLLGLPIAGIIALLAVVVAAHWWRRGAKVFAVGLVGLATCLASPLSWTHHYVWILPLGIAMLQQIARIRWAGPTDTRLPRWVTIASAVWVMWVSVCLMLAVLPYGHDVELTYNAGQEVIANFGPVLGSLIIIGLAVRLIKDSRERAALSAPSGRSEGSRPEPVEGLNAGSS